MMNRKKVNIENLNVDRMVIEKADVQLEQSKVVERLENLEQQIDELKEKHD